MIRKTLLLPHISQFRGFVMMMLFDQNSGARIMGYHAFKYWMLLYSKKQRGINRAQNVHQVGGDRRHGDNGDARGTNLSLFNGDHTAEMCRQRIEGNHVYRGIRMRQRTIQRHPTTRLLGLGYYSATQSESQDSTKNKIVTSCCMVLHTNNM